ncbi:MAG: hypothetical protein R3267_01915 [Paenisporosarcina sp.]|nr:hypothetical protein [Paenisporosarcina sp.]
MTKNNQILVEARQALNQLRAQVMEAQGYGFNSAPGEDVNYEIANELGFPSIRITVTSYPNS